MSKYIIFTKVTKTVTTKIPVIIPDLCEHSSIQLPGYTQTSAGFFHMNSGLCIVEDRQSTSLGIGPDDCDSILLNSVMSNSGSYAFQEFNFRK